MYGGIPSIRPIEAYSWLITANSVDRSSQCLSSTPSLNAGGQEGMLHISNAGGQEGMLHISWTALMSTWPTAFANSTPLEDNQRLFEFTATGGEAPVSLDAQYDLVHPHGKTVMYQSASVRDVTQVPGALV